MQGGSMGGGMNAMGGNYGNEFAGPDSFGMTSAGQNRNALSSLADSPRTSRYGQSVQVVQFTDGSSMKCERRERPQMFVGNDGKLIAFSSHVTVHLQ